MFDSAITSVIAIDTETNSIHFYSEPSAATPNNHLVANFRCRPFDDEFYEKFDKILKAYEQKNAGSQPAKVSLILPDHVFLTDTINIPTIGRRAMENSLELAIGAMYKNKNDLKYHTFSMAQKNLIEDIIEERRSANPGFEDYFADEYEELEQLPLLNLEYIPHRNDYRVFDPKFPQQTVAYVDSIHEAWHQHPEYRYVIV